METRKPSSATYHRVVAEREDLCTKHSKLDDFICVSDKFKTLSNEAKFLLEQQELVMKQYIEILNRRLAIWSDN